MASLAQIVQIDTPRQTRASKRPVARTLDIDEELPQELAESSGLARFGQIDPEWCWVLEHKGHVIACLLAVNAHGLAIMLRIVATSAAPHGWMVVLLRRALRDMQSRGCVAFATYLEDKNSAEAKLARIVIRHGGELIPAPGCWAVGPTGISGDEGGH